MRRTTRGGVAEVEVAIVGGEDAVAADAGGGAGAVDQARHAGEADEDGGGVAEVAGRVARVAVEQVPVVADLEGVDGRVAARPADELEAARRPAAVA